MHNRLFDDVICKPSIRDSTVLAKSLLRTFLEPFESIELNFPLQKDFLSLVAIFCKVIFVIDFGGILDK